MDKPPPDITLQGFKCVTLKDRKPGVDDHKMLLPFTEDGRQVLRLQPFEYLVDMWVEAPAPHGGPLTVFTFKQAAVSFAAMMYRRGLPPPIDGSWPTTPGYALYRCQYRPVGVTDGSARPWVHIDGCDLDPTGWPLENPEHRCTIRGPLPEGTRLAWAVRLTERVY